MESKLNHRKENKLYIVMGRYAGRILLMLIFVILFLYLIIYFCLFMFVIFYCIFFSVWEVFILYFTVKLSLDCSNLLQLYMKDTSVFNLSFFFPQNLMHITPYFIENKSRNIENLQALNPSLLFREDAFWLHKSNL